MAMKIKKISLEYHFLPCFIILLLSLLRSCCISFVDGYDVKEESSYDLGAYYPSYFGDDTFENHSGKKKLHRVSNSKKFIRRSLAALTINVLDYGAKGDGKTDDTEAFQKAWEEACSSSGDVNFVAAQNKYYLLKPIRFSGPCTSHITMQIGGNIIASDDRSHYNNDLRHWLVFDSVQNLIVKGGGIINGNGNKWWQNSCKINKSKPCTDAPTALTFYRCTNLVVQNLKIENAQQEHVSFEKSKNVVASNIVVNAPENSPNTDGIHVSDTQNIQISSCTIATGDDCISIVSGSQNVKAMGIICGPGHGISIGSLGDGNSKEYVSDVMVNGAKLYGTTNGVRIKTWQGGSGSASNIKFQNIEMQDVENPIIIDQNYCDHNKPCKKQASSAVQVKNVVYENITGTSASDVAVDFDCSKNHPCEMIVMKNVSLALENGENGKAVCKNVEFTNTGTLLSKFMNSGSVIPRCP
ncbi:Polygalacturonase 1 [Castilleja foliolosa]|uniref:endo-polygalacturonase n=1 Tax=Castilleja foliolosa TaxID=1961234 RepID=A0ABD3CUX5_9LAMI